MGIAIAEQTETFHVPFGTPNSEGTPEANYVDLKAHPEWIPVLPSCVGWPETQALLKAINAPASPFMSLAADQGFTWAESVERQIVLTSFVVLCFADISRNTKDAVLSLAQDLQYDMDHLLQDSCTKLGRRLHLRVRLELQPTRFHDYHTDGWSLMIVMAAPSNEKRLSRYLWGLGMTALQQSIQAFPHP